jgi:hypothetical protein
MLLQAYYIREMNINYCSHETLLGVLVVLN